MEKGELLPDHLLGRTPMDIASFWDGEADHYVSGPGSLSEVDKAILTLLAQNGDLKEEDLVLDIGCGPGQYSNFFAGLVRGVVALDISSKMIGHAMDLCRKNGRNNVEFMNMPWEDFSSERSFDLVFASFCPAICNLDALIKMESLSRRSCCIVTRGGPCHVDEHLQALGLLLGMRFSDEAYMAPLIIEALEGLGRRPRLHHFKIDRPKAIDRKLSMSIQRFIAAYSRGIGEGDKELFHRILSSIKCPQSIVMTVIIWSPRL
ncbi:MAG: methyltransferase domain-containing protein [Methanomassiliicoccales archaeon]|nr:MAG: methyltransferase domain-containing protein [Methanomassiliicoccales archaeon]